MNMLYKSTRDSLKEVTAAQAIAQGISDEGGLFVPAFLPTLTDDDFDRLASYDYNGRAVDILRRFLTDFTDSEIEDCVSAAYGANKFDTENPANMQTLYDNVNILELWHGPTCAFKDMALQLLPHLLTKSAQKVSPGKTTAILVATSGDTGKAALEGFKDVDGTKVVVFYPGEGVSMLQKMQMVTQEGANVRVFAINGNFDDAQTGVKKIFTDEKIKNTLAADNIQLSSANSINWGRLVPQIVYYVSAYCDLLASGKISKGDKFNVVVPTGNFGNILAAYYAMRMGVPITKLICASNKNKVLTDFINSGTYDKRRDFYVTASPSMDILISSNLERLLYELEDNDDGIIKSYMSALQRDGVYNVSDKCLKRMQSLFYAGYMDDEGTFGVIKECFEKYNYLCDTHTAVAIGVYEKYAAETGDATTTVIASTASPYKFPTSVLKALGKKADGDEFDRLYELNNVSGVKIPQSLAALKSKPVRFNETCTSENMAQKIVDYLLNRE